MKRSSRAVWTKRVEAWQESGLTAKVYARRIGVNPNTLTHWKWQLGHESRDNGEQDPAPSSLGHVESLTSGVSFVEVITGASVAMSAEPFEIVLSEGRRIRVPARFDTESLRALLTVLEPTS